LPPSTAAYQAITAPTSKAAATKKACITAATRALCKASAEAVTARSTRAWASGSGVPATMLVMVVS